MADDRPLETTEEAVGRIDGKLADIESTILARLSRLPTGTMLPTPASTAPPNTLLLQGQTVTRAAYPALWKWAVDHGAVVAGLFGAGDGTTTFTLPDARDRFLVGAGGTVTLGGTGGTATRTLTTANMPAHDHNVFLGNDSPSHTHFFTTDTTGGHFGHRPNTNPGVGGNDGSVWPTNFDGQGGAHSHSGQTGNAAQGHQHPVTESIVGSGAGFDQRPPFLAVNVLIYT